jgi:hypothetical protein
VDPLLESFLSQGHLRQYICCGKQICNTPHLDIHTKLSAFSFIECDFLDKPKTNITIKNTPSPCLLHQANAPTLPASMCPQSAHKEAGVLLQVDLHRPMTLLQIQLQDQHHLCVPLDPFLFHQDQTTPGLIIQDPHLHHKLHQTPLHLSAEHNPMVPVIANNMILPMSQSMEVL